MESRLENLERDVSNLEKSFESFVASEKASFSELKTNISVMSKLLTEIRDWQIAETTRDTTGIATKNSEKIRSLEDWRTETKASLRTLKVVFSIIGGLLTVINIILGWFLFR